MIRILPPQIVAVEKHLRQAMLCSDVGALDKLISLELIFANHLSQLVTKEEGHDEKNYSAPC